jgi:Bacterial Alpha-2-macroglobulin MG10 domain/Alpha-2-macroglobulin family/MG2 domain
MTRSLNPWPLVFLLNALAFLAFAGPRDAQWKKVQEALDRGLPRTAITNLEPIIRGALHDRAYGEAVRAITRKLLLEGNIQGNKPEEKITRLQAVLATAPREMAPLLDTVLAHWYWQYFQQNRWRFLQRTATAAPPGNDFTTWDLPRLFGAIDAQFQKALAAKAFLQRTPVAEWSDLLQPGTMPDSYRPTLYDFVAYEALQFYSSGEQAAAKPENAFELSADSPAFAPADQFLSWHPQAGAPPAPPEFSPTLRALHLYQDLLRFHQPDPKPRLAFAAADLERLTWAWNTAFGETKDAHYEAALERFIQTFADFDIAALALEREARVFQQENELVTAHKLAQRGATTFPNSAGGKLCHNLVAEIESKSISVQTERVWNCRTNSSGPAGEPALCPEMRVQYRNLDAVYFRAIPYDWDVFLQKDHNPPQSLNQKERREVLAGSPVLVWSEKFPPTTDYRQKTVPTRAPSQLKPGFYFIAASVNPDFSETDNVVSMAPVWVSQLSLVTRSREGRLEGFVLQANSGEPIVGAGIDIWRLDQGGGRIGEPSLVTDHDGFFSFQPEKNHGYLLRARYQDQALATAGDLWAYDWMAAHTPRPAARTVFFTDRALYRPGQTIQYKGICLWVDQAKNNYELLKGEEVTVVFRDPNGKEIARQPQRANDYGSFSGSFVAPRDRLLGLMTLQAEGRALGTASFRVEEYKRPKFQVTLEAPKTAARLNQRVSLTGHAMSYTGAAVDGAPVSYHVVREIRFPRWWWGWGLGLPLQGQSQEIARGTATTEIDGSFKIEFTARPDPKVPETNQPTFVYAINADVTDNAGETRSASRSIRVGYTALEATLTAADWQTAGIPVELKVGTKTLDDEPQVAEGVLRVYALQAPDKVHRAPLANQQFYYGYGVDFSRPGAPPDLSNPDNWPLGKMVDERGFTTDTNGEAKVSIALGVGAFRAVLETQDRFGKKVTSQRPLLVLEPSATHLGIKIPHLLTAPGWQAQPGQAFSALWGTGYPEGRAFIEIEHRHQFIERYWTRPGQTQQQIKFHVTEAMRGGVTVHVTQIHDNRAYLDSHRVDVPWSNKELDLSWEHFVSKLKPDQKETWTVVVKPRTPASGHSARSAHRAAKGERFAAEMVATLYDESLDAFAPHHWPRAFEIFYQDASYFQAQFANSSQNLDYVLGNWPTTYQPVEITYRSLPPDLTANYWGYQYFRMGRGAFGGSGGGAMSGESLVADRLVTGLDMTAAPAGMAKAVASRVPGPAAMEPAPAPAAQPSPNLAQVSARKNLNETAFFYPQLTTDSNGVVRMTFTMPEALTRWHFLGFAHDQRARSGFLEGHAVTAKDLMVQPNPPRFLREGDTLEFTVKVSNQSEQTQTGVVRLTFKDALTDQPADTLLDLRVAFPTGALPPRTTESARTDQRFSVPAKQSRSYSWRLTVPDGCGFLTYKAVAAAAHLSDGEEGAVPVLSRRILVTESLPLPIRGPATKKFEFTRLLKSGGSRTLQNQSLTLQMASHPAWYAVLALPYLMEYPYECSEQTFNRLYANALARFIAHSNPKIHRVFEQWKNTPTLESPLEKNQDLKSVALEETPWVQQAESESQARKNLGILFDENRLNYETKHTLQKLADLQLPDGAWPWFPGGPANDYITLYITTGFGRLRHLGIDIPIQPALRSLNRLDGWMKARYDRIQESAEPEKYVPSPIDALYLYGRSFFLKDQAFTPDNKKAVEFFLNQARKFWLRTDCRQTQGQLALALQRFRENSGFGLDGDPTPTDIMKSLKERSVSNEELGRFWRDTEPSWWWYRAPIETQALMIEAFDEVAHDAQAVEECQVWLLKQKQTQDWKTTKATADAVYALLLRGKDLLSSDALVRVKLDGLDITPRLGPARGKTAKAEPAVEPGTGFYEVRFTAAELRPKLGNITVRKLDSGVAWGSINWQYLEDMSKVTPYEGTPLKLKKALFVRTLTARGPVLEAVQGPLHVGDELVVRLELRVDRDMEYVHLKDQRGSGTEPVNVLSGYKYQDGLAYYESTRDTASHFFIDYLPKGTYVFEYSTRVQLRGRYQTGIAEIQCMYAPEFNSHSRSLELVVR